MQPTEGWKLFAFGRHRGGQLAEYPMEKPAILAAAAAFALLGAASLAQNRQLAAVQRAEWVKFNPVTPLTAASFAQPPAADRPWVRMKMPGTADPA